MPQLLDHLGRPIAAAETAPPTRRPVTNAQNRRMIKARFDTQFITDENRRHWGMMDAMSIDASASWMIRRVMRMKSRYEYHNNSYYMGMVSTVAAYCIGSGPRLQMLTPNKVLNKRIEKVWKDWAKEVGLAQTFLSLRSASIYNGEGFALMRNNPGLCHPVKLDVCEVEADQVASPLFGLYPAQYPDQYFDGKVLDPWGRPSEYHVLRQHPGAYGAFVLMGNEFDRWPARYVLHAYKRVRPGQQRGIPETTPCLEDFADLRRFGKATLSAAEQAAELAMTIETTAAADDGEGEDGDGDGGAYEAMDTVYLQRGGATVLPDGTKLGQLKAEHPSTTYQMFVNMKLQEIGRCLDFPVFFMSLDATQANMASAYIVTQPFNKSIQTDRANVYEPLLDRVFDEFLTEAMRIPGLLPADVHSVEEFPHAWQWPKLGSHADPKKVADARTMALDNGTTSIPHICAEDGDDWEEIQESDAKSLGMSVDEYRAALRQKRFAVAGTPTPASLDPEPDPVSPEAPGDDEPRDEDDV